MRSPFDWAARPIQFRGFVGITLLTLAAMYCMRQFDLPLMDGVPGGIIALEFAGDLATAEKMLSAWGPQEMVYAALSSGFDYLFMLCYALSIALGCGLVASRLALSHPRLSALGPLLAWGALAAGALDAIENYALIQLLLGDRAAHWPVVAFWCALPKFILVMVGLLYIVLGSLVSMRGGRVAA